MDRPDLRRGRSLSRLEAMGWTGVPASLPPARGTPAGDRPTARQAALRAIALCHVAVKADGLRHEVVRKLAVRYGVLEHFTVQERAFIENPHPADSVRASLATEHASYAVLLGALGFLPAWPWPDGPPDRAAAVKVLRDFGPEGFLRLARLRPDDELLDAADLADCMEACWPDGCDRTLFARQHAALTWLVAGGPWPEVPPATV